MKLEWLDDVLAVIDTGSFNEAARTRFLTQPAFSRRIQTIERAIGFELFDRSHKPVKLRQSVLEQESNLRELAEALRNLKHDLGSLVAPPAELTLVSQHAISTAIAPQIVQSITSEFDLRIRLRSANREECLSLLYAGKADIGLLFQLDVEPPLQHSQFIETHRIAAEPLVPVVAVDGYELLMSELNDNKLRIISYPKDVFLGKVLQSILKPQLEPTIDIQWIVETALTTAALEFALAGVGLAWVPLSLASSAIARSELLRLDPQLPSAMMSITALRLIRNDNSHIDSAWNQIRCAYN